MHFRAVLALSISLALSLAPCVASARDLARDLTIPITPRPLSTYLPTGARVCLMGDSRMYYNNFTQSPSVTGWMSRGDLLNAVASDPRVRFEEWKSISDPDASTIRLTTTAASSASTTMTFASTTGISTTGTAGVTPVGNATSPTYFISGPSIPQPLGISTPVTATTLTTASAVTVPAGETDTIAWTRGFYGANDGVAGQTTWQMAARAKWLAVMHCDLTIINGGINDGNSDATSIASLTSMANMLLAAGQHVMMTTVEPVALIENPTKALKQNLNSYIRSYAAATPGVSLCDLSLSLAADGAYAAPQFFMDGLHLSPLAAATVQGPALAACIAKIVSPGNAAGSIPANWLIQRYWQSGTNLLTNPTFTGTTGAKATANQTGTVPTSWSLGYNSSGTFYTTTVASLAANADTGGQLVNLSITPGAATVASENVMLYPTTAAITITAGQWYIGWAEVQLGATDQNYSGAFVQIKDNGTVVNYAEGSFFYDSTYDLMPPMARRVWLQTPLLKAGAGATSLNFEVGFTISTAPAVTLTSVATVATGNQAPAANQTQFTAGVGVTIGMVATSSCSGASIPAGTTVIGAPLSWFYVTFSNPVTIPASCAVLFSPPSTLATQVDTPSIRRVWLGLADPPALAWNSSVQ